MHALAFDLSLTRTGWAGPTLDRCGVLVPPRGQDRGEARLCWIRDAVLELSCDADVVVLEGYGFAAGRGPAPHQMGELGGVVRVALFEAQTPVVVVPPATLKKLATGKGNAPKEAVLVAAVRRLGYGGSDHNEADALWLLAAALVAFELPGAPELPKTHVEALAKTVWPALALEATA
jgi:Holliday junction resolvasome RuvABC endonuclease subunit